MDVTPQELRGNEIKDSWRGYDRDEVDDLLERAAVTIEGLAQRLQEAASRPARPAAAPVAPEPVPLPSSRDDADMLQRTLLLAQRAADDAVSEAQARAQEMLEESEAKAQALVSDAEATARRIAEGERRRLEAEIVELSARREQLRADADALDLYASGYRDRLRAAIESDLAQLGSDIAPPGPRPELHDVDMPVPVAEMPPADKPVAAASTPDPTPGPGSGDAFALGATGDAPGPWDSGPETRAVGALGGDDAAPGGSGSSYVGLVSSPVAAPARPASEWPPPPVVDAAHGPAPAESSWLSTGDDWVSAETAWDAKAPWERDAPTEDTVFEAAAFPPLQADDAAPQSAFASDVPMDPNPVDTDALDDDAFFASLREAVRDDEPLGPRDDDQGDFFDGDLEQDRRRFRRRR